MKKQIAKQMALSVLIAALLVLAACETSSPTQIISGVIISSFDGRDNAGFRGTYFTVPTNEDEKLFFLLEGRKSKYPDIKVGSSIVFRWDSTCEQRGWADLNHLISINGKSP